MAKGRTIIKDRLNRAGNHLEDSLDFLSQTRVHFGAYGDHYKKYQEYLESLEAIIYLALENIRKLNEKI